MRTRRPILQLALLSGLAGGAGAQSNADVVYHLHGSVVNGVTGRPIGRALVISQDRRLATMTDAEGQFALDVSVPAAQQAQSGAQAISTFPDSGSQAGSSSQQAFAAGLSLSAQRPGYLQSRLPIAVALDAAADTRNIQLRLMPAASIHGQVTATGNEGYHGARVQLLHHAVQDGRLVWQVTNTRPVLGDGTFTMSGLQPGEYTVVTSEWAPSGRFNVATTAPVATPTAASEQYPPDFLGDTRTLAGATRLHLVYGQSAQANLHLRPAPYHAVTVPVQGLPENAGVSVRVSTNAGVQLYQLGWNLRDRAVEGALPDGDYLLSVSGFGAERRYAQVPIHVAGAPVEHAPVGLTPLESIPVLVRDERTTPSGKGVTIAIGVSPGAPTPVQTPGFFLSARPVDASEGGGDMMQATAGGPVLQHLQPGRYYLQGSAIGRGYISSMTCDGVDLLAQPFVVNDSGHTAPVEITLRDDEGTIAGTVEMGSSGAEAARVLIVPTDGSGHVVYSYATGSGLFQASNVPPGSYRVLATATDAPELPFRDAEAMRPFSSKGGAVTVVAGQTAQVETRLLDAVESGSEP